VKMHKSKLPHQIQSKMEQDIPQKESLIFFSSLSL